MTGTSTLAGDHTFGCEHAMNIVRPGFRSHEDDISAVFFCPAFGKTRVKCDDTYRGTRRNVQPLGDGLYFFEGICLQLRMQEEVNLVRFHT